MLKHLGLHPLLLTEESFTASRRIKCVVYALHRFSFTVDGSQTLRPVVIGTSTSPGSTYKLYVNGAAYATGFTTSGTVTAGSLSVAGSKSFDALATYNSGCRIRHGCM